MSGFLLMAAAAAVQCGNLKTQVDISQCTYAAYLKADADLGRQWAITSLAMKERDKARDVGHDQRQGYFAALLAAQRAWLKYRDAHCVSEGYQMRGGSGEGMVVSLCLERLTRERIVQLERIAKGY